MSQFEGVPVERVIDAVQKFEEEYAFDDALDQLMVAGAEELKRIEQQELELAHARSECEWLHALTKTLVEIRRQQMPTREAMSTLRLFFSTHAMPFPAT